MADEHDKEHTLGGGNTPDWQTVPTPQHVPPAYPLAPPQQAYPPPPQQAYPPPPPQNYPPSSQPTYGQPVYGGQPAYPPAYNAPPRKRRTWIGWLIGIALLMFLLFFVGCWKLFSAFRHAGALDVVPLHKRMTEADYAGIFANADPQYQTDVGRAQSDQVFATVHQYLGSPEYYTVSSINTNTNSTDGTVKDYVISTTFEHGTGTERLRFRKDSSGTWRLLRYNCNSPQLNGVQPVTPDGNSNERTF